MESGLSAAALKPITSYPRTSSGSMGRAVCRCGAELYSRGKGQKPSRVLMTPPFPS